MSAEFDYEDFQKCIKDRSIDQFVNITRKIPTLTREEFPDSMPLSELMPIPEDNYIVLPEVFDSKLKWTPKETKIEIMRTLIQLAELQVLGRPPYQGYDKNLEVLTVGDIRKMVQDGSINYIYLDDFDPDLSRTAICKKLFK